MGIYISNMNKPMYCYVCLLRQGDYCLLLNATVPSTIPPKRLDDCPLIELPQEERAMSLIKDYIALIEGERRTE